MARPEKAAKAAELGQKLTSSAAVVLAEYRGLTVKDLQDLRRSLGGDATYAVAKDTLALLTAREAGIDSIESTLVGPTAFTFITGDIAKVTKGLHDFAKAHPLLAIKGGVLEGKFLDAKVVLKLADLKSREILLSKMVGAMKGSLVKAVGTLAAPLSKSAHLLDVPQSVVEENPDLIDGAGSAPATEATSEDAAAGDTAPAEEARAAAIAERKSVAA